MKNDQLRKLIRKYLDHPRSISQSELERAIGMGKGSMTHFLHGRETAISLETERKILNIVAPWMTNKLCIAGAIATSLLKKRFNETEIAAIGHEMTMMGSLSGLPVRNELQR